MLTTFSSALICASEKTFAMRGKAFVEHMLHVWRRNTLLSIVAGTVVYMLLVQLVFV